MTCVRAKHPSLQDRQLRDSQRFGRCVASGGAENGSVETYRDRSGGAFTRAGGSDAGSART
jgi:hypothetical protein